MGALLMSDTFITDIRAALDSEKIEAIKDKAKELSTARVEHSEALAQLRGYNNVIDGPCRDGELVAFLRSSRRGRVTIADLVKPGDKLSLKTQPFYLNGVITPRDTNLVVGREKKGKSSFVIAWIAAWHFGQTSFCDFDLLGDCPPVIIIGPDMSAKQWGKMLCQYHLADDEGELLPNGPIKMLLHMGHDFCLDQHGFDLIDELAELHPGALFIFDSYSRLVSPLGLREESADLAGPLIAAQGILRNRDATDIWLHHSAANRDTGKATSRGSTALPAAADQIIYLESPTANEDDNRTQLRTRGREMPVMALIERTKPDGVWVCHASGDELVQQQTIVRKINGLRKGIALDIFNAMQVLHPKHELGVSYREIADAIGMEEDQLSKLYKPMGVLTGQALVSEHGINRDASSDQGGRPNMLFRLPRNVAVALDLPARGNALIIPETPETPISNGSQPLARIGKIDRTFSLLQKHSAGTDLSDSDDFCDSDDSEVSGVSGISKRADLTTVSPSNPSHDEVSGVNGVIRAPRREGQLLECAAPSTNGHHQLALDQPISPLPIDWDETF